MIPRSALSICTRRLRPPHFLNILSPPIRQPRSSFQQQKSAIQAASACHHACTPIFYSQALRSAGFHTPLCRRNELFRHWHPCFWRQASIRRYITVRNSSIAAPTLPTVELHTPICRGNEPPPPLHPCFRRRIFIRRCTAETNRLNCYQSMRQLAGPRQLKYISHGSAVLHPQAVHP